MNPSRTYLRILPCLFIVFCALAAVAGAQSVPKDSGFKGAFAGLWMSSRE
jgi:hypothetical protein